LRLAGNAASATEPDRKGRTRSEGRPPVGEKDPRELRVGHTAGCPEPASVGGGGYGVGFRKEVESGADGVVFRKEGGVGTAGDALGGPEEIGAAQAAKTTRGFSLFRVQFLPHAARRTWRGDHCHRHSLRSLR